MSCQTASESSPNPRAIRAFDLEINRHGVTFDRELNYDYVATLKVASVSEVEQGATGAARAVREDVRGALDEVEDLIGRMETLL